MIELEPSEITDPVVWNRFVEHARYRSFPQLWEWGELRQTFGWRALRIGVGSGPRGVPIAGAQLLIRRLPLIGWGLAYAPRGPIGEMDDPEVRAAMYAALRAVAGRYRIATVKVDPETSRATPYGRWLLERPWRPSRKVQPPSTRVIDLSPPEDALWAAMRRKHRQSVNRARREGVGVEVVERSTSLDDVARALRDFHRIYEETARRAGFVARHLRYYERLWEVFSPAGHVNLYFATRGGERVATLFHFVVGGRVATVYGGMTEPGAALRANYLLRWEAMSRAKRAGSQSYDLWGLATEGIRQFKEGFGGETRAYVGARDLPLNVPLDRVLRGVVPAYRAMQHARLRLAGRDLAISDE